MASVEKVPMLAEGYEKLSTQLAALKAERPQNVDAIEEARAHGDLSQNAEYHAAKTPEGQGESSSGDPEDPLYRPQVIHPMTVTSDPSVVGRTGTLAGRGGQNDKKPLISQ